MICLILLVVLVQFLRLTMVLKLHDLILKSMYKAYIKLACMNVLLCGATTLTHALKVLGTHGW